MTVDGLTLLILLLCMCCSLPLRCPLKLLGVHRPRQYLEEGVLVLFGLQVLRSTSSLPFMMWASGSSCDS